MSSAEANPNTTAAAAGFPLPTEGILVTHFIVSHDVERSRRFYTDVLGSPTDDKPTVTLEAPRASDRDRVNSFLNLRVADGYLIEVGQTTRPPS